jgi:hypothetical protein
MLELENELNGLIEENKSIVQPIKSKKNNKQVNIRNELKKLNYKY